MSSPTASSENKLTSDRYADFVEALDTLYIKNNIGGRNQFTLAWPDVAVYVFGAELLQYDRDGTQDRDRRAVLEEEADDRRGALLETLLTIEVKSVDKGALQLEYVQGLINQLGRNVALLVYGRWLVDRFIPPPPSEIQPVAPAQTRAAEKPVMPPANSMDHIKPISVEPDHSPAHSPWAHAGSEATPVTEPEPPSKPKEEPEQLIVETQGATEVTLPVAAAQESMAPVLGGAEKKGGLKILSISENDESKNGEDNQ